MFDRVRLLDLLWHNKRACLFHTASSTRVLLGDHRSKSVTLVARHPLNDVYGRLRSLGLAVLHAGVVIGLLERLDAILVVDQSWWEEAEVSVFASLATRFADGILELGLH